jgi:class 3 adenylate cyclase
MAGDDSTSGSSARRRLAAILAADVAGYSRLMAEDEQATLTALDAARAVFRECIEWHGGRVIDMAGDSVLAVFDAATAAVHAALAIQRGLGTGETGETAGSAAPPRMQFRIGVHLGDVMERSDGTVYGDGVNIAARLEGLAEPGSVTVSDAVRTAVRGKLVARFDDLGLQQVKNIAEPLRAYRASESPHAHAPRRRSGSGRRRSDHPQVLQHLLIEVFFIVLPLAALWANWSDDAMRQPHAFSAHPAWPMTACLLYGLSVVRLLPALQVGAAQRKRHEGTAVLLLLLLPLAGVVASVILIAKLSAPPAGDGTIVASYVNLTFALLCFAVLGGWGIRGEASERGGRSLG